ncbi:MFS transporter [Allostreptomyces psammosilenae]|uniref:MFS family permease n=1 Tax=Allostreptomyces psammosilenae TaxID=1892865 RepID=A0A852ZU61_9ACTN|nr:MFS transporter [Allostreptomyces psammosilenae]NYI05425.1 MFS family permease [Allostreptomyces psammosilenae]
MAHLSDLRTLLRLPGFRRLFATRLTSQCADGAFQVALASYVIFSPERLPSPAAIAGAFAVLLLPYSVVGPFAGVLLDRFSRRGVLVVCNLLRAAAMPAVIALVVADAPTWAFYTAALLVLAVNRFVLAGLSASLPRVVEPAILVTANAVSPTAGTIAATAGGGLALAVGLLLPTGAVTTGAVLITTALLYGCSALAAAGFRPGALGPGTEERLARAPVGRELAGTARGMLDGVRHLRERPRAGHALLAVVAMRFGYGLLTVTLLMLSRYTFNDPADPEAGMALLGVVVAASGAGFLLAALVTPYFAHRLGEGGWTVCCAAAGAVLVPALALPFRQDLAVAAALVLGMVTQGVKISTDTVVQRGVDDDYRGRVFSVYDVLFNASFVAAAAVAAAVLPPDGRSAVPVLVTAVLYAVTALAQALAARHPGSGPRLTIT